MAQTQNDIQTIAITNFGGRLTRKLNGDLNSGFAKFTSSFGYDPFSKPDNLTWLYQPTDIASSVITDAIYAAKVWSFDTTSRLVYAIGSAARLYKINPTNSATTIAPLTDAPTLLTTLTASSPTFNYGADLTFFNGKIYISSDALITTTDFSGGNETVVTGGSPATNIYHPFVQFAGKLFFGNGNNLGSIDATNLITSTTVLSPALPTGMYIKDLDVTPDGNYMVITASYIYPENVTAGSGGDRGDPYASDSFQFMWNGTDLGVTASTTNPSWSVTAYNTFLNSQYSFMDDAFGTALFEGTTKLLTLPQNVPPMPAGSSANGEFLTWASPEVIGAVNSSTQGTATAASLYYYGALDGENQPGLWRMMRQAPTATKKTWRTPLNMMVNSFSFSTNLVLGWGKHYISVFETGSPNSFHLYRFVLPPAADTAPQLGVYETQNQIFSKKVTIKQVRFYVEPTVANNGFQLDIIGSDGNPITNGTFTYTFTSGTDITKLQGALDRIDFNPAALNLYSAGLRITNTGSANMTFHKIEVDWSESGK